jgi:hypothetical protein
VIRLTYLNLYAGFGGLPVQYNNHLLLTLFYIGKHGPPRLKTLNSGFPVIWDPRCLSRINISDHIFERLVTIVRLKTIKILCQFSVAEPKSGMEVDGTNPDPGRKNPDPGSGMEKSRSGMEKSRSGIRDKHPGYETLLFKFH